MAIQSGQNQEIEYCTICNGIGYKGSNPNNICPECRGGGIYIDYSDNRLTFNLPLYVNFKHRANQKLYQILFYLGVIFGIFLIAGIIIFLLFIK